MIVWVITEHLGHGEGYSVLGVWATTAAAMDAYADEHWLGPDQAGRFNNFTHYDDAVYPAGMRFRVATPHEVAQ